MALYNGKKPKLCRKCGVRTLRWQVRKARWKCATAGCGFATSEPPQEASRPPREDRGPGPTPPATRSNQKTARLAAEYLAKLGLGFQLVSGEEKRNIARACKVPSSSFDMIRQTRRGIKDLIEVKGTKRFSAKDHFFSVSKTEVDASKTCRKRGQERYRFVIVYDLDGEPRHEEFSWDELEARIKSRTLQYSIRLKPL